MTFEEQAGVVKTILRVGRGKGNEPFRTAHEHALAARNELANLHAFPGKRSELNQLRQFHLSLEVGYDFGQPEAGIEDAKNNALVTQAQTALQNQTNNFIENPLNKKRAWVVMGSAFYGHYVDNEFDQALDELKTVESAIRTWKTAHGTWSRLHFFRAHCYRAKRDFASAEEHFAAAQYHAHERLLSKLDLSKDKTTNERRAAIAWTSRILNGLAWTLIQQGRLKRASQILLSSRTILTGVGNQYLNLNGRYLHAMAKRRLYDPITEKDLWKLSMSELKKCLQEFQSSDDRRGIRRCAQELCRGYLDLAEEDGGLSGTDRTAAVEMIHLLNKAAEDRLLVKKGEPPEKSRAIALEVHLNLVLGNTAEAIKNLDKLISMVENDRSRLEGGQLDLISLAVAVAEPLCDLAKVSDIVGKPGGSKWKARESDPVATAEVALQTAIIARRTKQHFVADQCLQIWKSLEANVDNHYLRNLHRKLERVGITEIAFSPAQEITDLSGDYWNHLQGKAETLMKAYGEAIRNKHPDATNPQLQRLIGVAVNTFSKYIPSKKK